MILAEGKVCVYQAEGQEAQRARNKRRHGLWWEWEECTCVVGETVTGVGHPVQSEL